MGDRQGHGHLSLPAQRRRACRGGNTKHQQADRYKKAKYGEKFLESHPRTHSTFLYTIELTSKQRKMERSALCRHLNLAAT